jgi:hypothetical protein
MFRRTTCALLILLTAGFFCLSGAEESIPSNTVGYWKLTVHRGFNQFSFPLLPVDKSVNNVLAGQLTGGAAPAQSDQVLRWNHATNTFQMVWYNTGTSTWQGDFTDFAEGMSYWIYVQPDHPLTQTLVTFGNVVETPSFNMGAMTAGYNAVGSVWAAPSPLPQAGLTGFVGGTYLFQSDILMSYDALTGSTSYAWKNQGGVWQGNLTQLEPLKGYWLYVSPGHAGFNWNNYPQPIMGPSPFFFPPPTIGVDPAGPVIAAPMPPIPAPDTETKSATPAVSARHGQARHGQGDK